MTTELAANRAPLTGHIAVGAHVASATFASGIFEACSLAVTGERIHFRIRDIIIFIPRARASVLTRNPAVRVVTHTLGQFVTRTRAGAHFIDELEMRCSRGYHCRPRTLELTVLPSVPFFANTYTLLVANTMSVTYAVGCKWADNPAVQPSGLMITIAYGIFVAHAPSVAHAVGCGWADHLTGYALELPRRGAIAVTSEQTKIVEVIVAAAAAAEGPVGAQVTPFVQRAPVSVVERVGRPGVPQLVGAAVGTRVAQVTHTGPLEPTQAITRAIPAIDIDRTRGVAVLIHISCSFLLRYHHIVIHDSCVTDRIGVRGWIALAHAECCTLSLSSPRARECNVGATSQWPPSRTFVLACVAYKTVDAGANCFLLAKISRANAVSGTQFVRDGILWTFPAAR